MEKIIIEQHHGIGDLVHMLPFLKSLRKKFPKAKIDMILGSKEQEEIIRSTGIADNVYLLTLSKMSKKEIIKFILKIRSQRYDIGFIAPSTTNWKGRALLYLIGCKKKVFFGVENKTGIVGREYITKKDESRHVIERSLDLLRRIDNNTIDIEYFNIISPKCIEIESLLGFNPINDSPIVCCVGTGDTIIFKEGKKYIENVKKWDIKKWAALIETLSKHKKVVLLGGKKEEEELNQIDEDFFKGDNIINLINKISLMDSVAIIKNSALVISGDTGLLHIADSMQKNTIGIFGPSNPNIVGPISEYKHNVYLGIECQFCMDTHVLWDCTKRRCLDGITVDMIKDKVFEIIEL